MILPKLKSHIKKRIMTSGSRVSCGPSCRSTSHSGMRRSTRRVQGDGQGGWVAPLSIPEVALRFHKDTGRHGDTFVTIAEVIELIDPFLLYLKVLTQGSKYPDIRDELISTLLAVWSNVSRQVKQIIIKALEQGPMQANSNYVPTFKEIMVLSLNVAKLLKKPVSFQLCVPYYALISPTFRNILTQQWLSRVHIRCFSFSCLSLEVPSMLLVRWPRTRPLDKWLADCDSSGFLNFCCQHPLWGRILMQNASWLTVYHEG